MKSANTNKTSKSDSDQKVQSISDDHRFSVIETLQDMIFIHDTDGRVSYVNKAGIEQSGYSEKEILGINVMQFIPSEYYPLMQELHLKRVQGERDVLTYEIEYLKKNGEKIPVQVSSSPIYKNNNLECVIHIVKNISDIKDAEKILSFQIGLVTSLAQTTSMKLALKQVLNTALKISDVDCGGVYIFDEKNSEFNLECFENISDKNSLLLKKVNYQIVATDEPLFVKGSESTDKLSKEIFDILRKSEKVKFFSIIPFYHKQKIVGTLNIGSHEKDDISEFSKKALISLSQTIGGTISRIKAEELLKESERNYKEIVESANSIITKFDKTGKILSMNRYGLSFFGFREGEIVGKSAFETILPEYESTGRNLKNLLTDIFAKEDRNVTNINENVKKNGERVWINWTNKPIKDKDGNLLYFLSVGNDITGQIKLQEEVKQSELKFKTLFDKAYDPIFILDKDFFIKDTNYASVSLFHYSREKLIGKSIYELAAPLETKRLQHISKKEHDGSSVFLETNFIKKTGRVFPAEINLTSLEITGEKYIICTIRDITQHKQKEDELKRQVLKYNLIEGNLYLSKDPSNNLPFEAFKELVDIGYRGIIISRNEFETFYDGNIDFEYYWLSSRKGPNTLPPDINELKEFLSKGDGKKVILLDSIDHLIAKNGFNDVYVFVSWLRELSFFENNIVILSADLDTADPRKIKLIEKETKPILPKSSDILNERMIEIMVYILNQNKLGVNPCYSNIGNDLKMTRPTVRKNLRFLETNKYVLVHKKGRNKRLEITEKGKKIT